MKTQNKWQQLGQAISELEFITSVFSWLFNFFSRIAEPLMTLAVIYTIIVSGLPQAMVPTLYRTALAVMIGAPEIILPGAFIMAGQQYRARNKGALMLFAVCMLFVLLTSLTLADLFIFHFNSTGTSILMCGRCVTGVSYSILIRVVNYEQGSPQSRASHPTFDPQAFMNEILSQMSDMNQQLILGLNYSQEKLFSKFTERNQESIGQISTRIEQFIERCLEQVETSSSACQSPSNDNRSQSLAHIKRESPSQHSLSSTLRADTEPIRLQTHEPADVQPDDAELHKSYSSFEVHGYEHANREQVCTFILNHWREHGIKPTIKFIKANTGCSQGLASICCNLVAQEMKA